MSDADPVVRALELRRDDLRTTRVTTASLPAVPAGSALLRVETVGLTANNVTYGVTGEALGYWSFFPAEPGWGRLPVWGFATVDRSEVDGVRVGERYFGYLPLASHLLVEPTAVRDSGFTDGMQHRASLPSPYNSYRSVSYDSLYRADAEDAQAVLLPLFLTSFVLEDYLADNAWFDAEVVVLTSASAKTTIGTALLAARREDRPRLVGLTSPRNRAFTEALGCYDTVVTYDAVASLDGSARSVLVDVAGNPAVRTALHDRLDTSLAASVAVGLSHWDAGTPSAPSRGPRPQFFFAPAQVTKRVEEWGPAQYQRRLASAWHGLVDAVLPWLVIRSLSGVDAAPGAVEMLMDGMVEPNEALVLRLS